MRAKARLERDRTRDLYFDNQLQVAMKFEVDKDLVTMRSPFNEVS
jgi:hypothetical protein